MMNKKIVPALVLSACLFYVLVPGAFSQEPTNEERVVTLVRIDGNKSISGETILS